MSFITNVFKSGMCWGMKSRMSVNVHKGVDSVVKTVLSRRTVETADESTVSPSKSPKERVKSVLKGAGKFVVRSYVTVKKRLQG